ncbi:hypothetical protein ETW24_02700 [Leisingera sp. NJS204]|nr:hypothetical protein ETW24_02700 [Leisingera sp. NJS204]
MAISVPAFNDPSGASLNADPVNVRNIYRQQFISITFGQRVIARSESGYEPAPQQPQMPGETLLQSFPGFLRREKTDINEGYQRHSIEPRHAAFERERDGDTAQKRPGANLSLRTGPRTEPSSGSLPHPTISAR